MVCMLSKSSSCGVRTRVARTMGVRSIGARAMVVPCRDRYTAHSSRQAVNRCLLPRSPLLVAWARRLSLSQPAAEKLAPEEWVDAYGDYLYRYANSRLRDTNAAEEVVQETFLSGIRYFHQYSGSGSQRGWLMGILRRKIVDFLRTRSRQLQSRSAPEDFDPTSLFFDENGRWKEGALPTIEPNLSVEKDELWQIVKGCLKHLPPGQADVFVLSVMEEMATSEVCRELNITPSNLWVRLHRARLSLAKCVGSKWMMDSGVNGHE